jgi:RNA polymerase sigma factor (sigma-70 family)
VGMVTADLISRARAGDGEAFRQLTESHRRELQLHCYRMLGSFQDAEDALQDTLLAAWQGLGGFQGRASLRTRLYRIATNRCLSARRSASRRPTKAWDLPQVAPPEPTRLGEVVWLQPYPDALDPLRHQRARMVRAAAIAAEPIASFPAPAARPAPRWSRRGPPRRPRRSPPPRCAQAQTRLRNRRTPLSRLALSPGSGLWSIT